MKKKLFSILALFIFLTACSSDSETQESASEGLAIYGWRLGVDEAEDPIFNEWATEQLGYEVTSDIPADDYEKQLAAALASGELFDLVYMQQENYYELVDQGALTDLTDYIENSEILSNPDIVDPNLYYESLTAQDGGIYALPTKYEGGLVATVRNDWLQEWNMDVPSTLEDWEKYFDKCNTEKDAYGISLRQIDYIQPWMSGFGIYEGLEENSDGTYSVPYASEDAIEAWQWWADMYSEGYMDPNFETNSSSDFRDGFMSGQVGATGYWFHWVAQYDEYVNSDDSNDAYGTFDTIGVGAVPDKDGNKVLSLGDLSLLAIPTNSENPEHAIEMMELLYSDEGSMTGVFGYEGHDYNYNDDGEIELTDTGIDHKLNHGAAYPVNETWEMPEGFDSDYQGDEDDARVLVDNQGQVVIKNADWPEINEILQKYSAQIIQGQTTSEEGVAMMQEEIIALSNDNYEYTFNE